MKVTVTRGYITGEEMLYEFFGGDIPDCPVCSNPAGTDEGCMVCAYTLRESKKKWMRNQ